jgi:hypothetical protein
MVITPATAVSSALSTVFVITAVFFSMIWLLVSLIDLGLVSQRVCVRVDEQVHIYGNVVM